MRRKIILACILGFFLEITFCKLAFWQYTRFHEKEAEKSMIISSFSANQITLTGVFDNSRTAVLESQPYRGIYGYRVITPFVVGGEEYIVDQGWIPRQFNPAFLKEYATTGPTTVMGVLRPFRVRKQTLFTGPLYGQGPEGVLVLNVLTKDAVPQMPDSAQRHSYYVQATSPIHPKITAFFAQPLGGEKHREYMLTWLALALVLPFLLYQFCRKRG